MAYAVLMTSRFGRKVQAFEAALDDGVFRRQFPNRDDFEALVPTTFGSTEWVDVEGKTTYGAPYAAHNR